MRFLESKKISFIGGGNMAQAMIGGLLAKGFKPSLITVAEPNEAARNKLEEKGLKTVDAAVNPTAAVEGADIIVLAVKPQIMGAVVAEFKNALTDQLVISIAAGLPVSTISTMLGGYKTIVRAMPNTPAMLQMGASGLYAPSEISEEQKQLALAVMSSAGLALWVEEEDHLHAVTAVSGSAPAYFFYFLENMIEAAVDLGLTPKQASALAMQTALGSAQMSIVSDTSPSQLRENVTSPNGTTHEAIEFMKAHKVGEHIQQAMKACSDRSIELSKAL